MTRTAVGFDRVIVLLFGVGFLGAAAGLLGWYKHRIAEGRAVALSVGTWTAAGWWAWAIGGVGVLLVLSGLRWLVSHRPAPRLHRIPVSGAEGGSVDAVAVASAAADVLNADPSVTKARGTAVLERGRRVVTLTVTAPVRHGIAPALRAADDAARTAASMLGDGVDVRTVVRADAKGGTIVR